MAEDFDAVLVYLREEKLLCPGCGLPRDETMTPEAEGHFRAKAFRCFACAAREREADRFPADRRHGLYFSPVKR